MGDFKAYKLGYNDALKAIGGIYDMLRQQEADGFLRPADVDFYIRKAIEDLERRD